MRLLLIVFIGLMVLKSASIAQTHTEKINRELSFEKQSAANAIVIANINGSIKVEGYDGQKVLVEVIKSVSAKTEARLEKGKQQLQLGVIDRADTLVLYVEDGCNSFGKANRRGNGEWKQGGWGYNWDCNKGNCKTEYDYKMDFVIKVPATINVFASTINEGNISVAKVSGTVKANNINGSIALANLVKEAEASTINGDVDIDYEKNPSNDCRFYSLNGDINALFNKGLAANLSFESFNGEFYTNVDKIEALPAKVEKTGNGDGIKYKVNGNRYKVGNGGVFLDFETFNGNVYLKEK
ncbi:hypothetical protein [Chryseosolibacter indicus]|uniref:Adhesin domain-containing protein n=1 Tax=Chryseosolibacter indicus TaxID=2782351 RepID=A0ABS5VW64_9BACT|nr:hypothetical protein [Chryseosolibacter indicus]MBT1705663.1 hypothetical protein [Chryseosolibacter indicus]